MNLYADKLLLFFFYNLAPGSYDVEKADKKIHESSPAFSLGVKYKEPKPEEIPGKYIYDLLFQMTVIIQILYVTKLFI